MLSGLSEDELVRLMATVGTHRNDRPLRPAEVSDLLAKAKKHNSMESIRKDLQLKDPTVLNDFLALQKLPEELRALTDWGGQPGKLSFSASARISKIDNAELRSRVAQAVIEHRLSKDELATILQRIRRACVDLSQALDEVLRLRPVIEHNHIYMGKLPSDVVDLEDAKARIRRYLAQLVGARNIVSVGLGSGSYVFVLTDAGKQEIDSSARKSVALNPSNMDRTVAGILANDE